MKKITIEIVSDIICPWCYIGKARLERAIQLVEGELEVDVKMRPFFLYPNTPKGGRPKDDFKSVRKPGLGALLRDEAAKENLVIDYRKIERIPNTFEAHRLMHLCTDDAQRNELGKRLFQDFFERGKDVEDPITLAAAASACEMDKDLIKQFLETDIGADAVQAEMDALKADGISVVPTFILNGEHSVAGAQPMENFQRYFSRLLR